MSVENLCLYGFIRYSINLLIVLSNAELFANWINETYEYIYFRSNPSLPPPPIPSFDAFNIEIILAAFSGDILLSMRKE